MSLSLTNSESRARLAPSKSPPFRQTRVARAAECRARSAAPCPDEWRADRPMEDCRFPSARADIGREGVGHGRVQARVGDERQDDARGKCRWGSSLRLDGASSRARDDKCGGISRDGRNVLACRGADCHTERPEPTNKKSPLRRDFASPLTDLNRRPLPYHGALDGRVGSDSLCLRHLPR